MVPVTLPDVAVIVVLVPDASLAVTNPVLETVATLELEDVQVTEFVTFCVLPSDNVAVATS